MKRQDFYFDLPEELIAQYPLPNRTDSRLLVYEKGRPSLAHQRFNQLIDWLEPGDLLIKNDSKVIPARIYGQKRSGGKIECLLERILSATTCLMHIKASKSPKPGTEILLDGGFVMRVLEKQDALYLCEFAEEVLSVLQQSGHVPLPPYIRREDNEKDVARYQTVYAKHPGSVAAPTAGLHFDDALIHALVQKGVLFGYTTLHVGAGTFQPVRVDDIKAHKMHQETIWVDETLCQQVFAAKARGSRVICVGTTALRAVESAAQKGQIEPFCGETDIFIYPGYTFKVADGLITNFHLPESTLMMLVSAFIGYEQTMSLYREAVAQNYRFFSYGDASLLLNIPSKERAQCI